MSSCFSFLFFMISSSIGEVVCGSRSTVAHRVSCGVSLGSAMHVHDDVLIQMHGR